MKKFTIPLIVIIYGVLVFFISCSVQNTPYQRQSSELTGYEQPLTVRVKVILLQRNDGSGNFDLNDPVEAKDLKDYVQSALDGYKNFVKPSDLTGCYDGLDFMPTALLDFDVEYAEVKNTYGWNYRNTGSDLYKNKLSGFSPSPRWYLHAVDDSITQAEKEPSIHIYLTIDGERFDHIIETKGADFINNGKAAGQFPSTSDFDRSSQIHLPNVYLSYISMKHQAPKNYDKPWFNEVRNWFVVEGGKGLTHELGHVLGLSHSNAHHGANKCKYSIMSQKPNHPRNYLQPTEIKKIHKKLQTTNLMSFVTAKSHYDFTQAISTSTVWDNTQRFYNNFSVKPNVELTIKDSIIMPLDSHISIEKGAIVRLEGDGIVTYPNGKKFNGWNIQGKLLN